MQVSRRVRAANRAIDHTPTLDAVKGSVGSRYNRTRARFRGPCSVQVDQFRPGWRVPASFDATSMHLSVMSLGDHSLITLLASGQRMSPS